MYKSANIHKRAEGCHPSTVERQASRRANGAALDPATEAANAPATRHAAPPRTPPPATRRPRRRHTPGTLPGQPCPASPARPRPRPMGDRTARAGGASGTVIGGVARTRGAGSARERERFAVGDVVRNASGRGVWGKGTVLAVIPPDVYPWVWCKRRGLPLVFGRRCGPEFYERYIVRGDDGALHTPRRVARVRP